VRLDTVLVFAIFAFITRLCAEYNAALRGSDGRWVGIPALRIGALGTKLTQRRGLRTFWGSVRWFWR
jgi:hypothetical protein